MDSFHEVDQEPANLGVAAHAVDEQAAQRCIEVTPNVSAASTRNTRRFADLDVESVDPWSSEP